MAGLRGLPEAGVQEVLVIALHAVDGGVDDLERGCAEAARGLADAVDGELAGAGVADDAALADVLAPGFELGLDEDDGATAPGGSGGCARGRGGRGRGG